MVLAVSMDSVASNVPSAERAAIIPRGMLLPVQALTMDFVFETAAALGAAGSSPYALSAGEQLSPEMTSMHVQSTARAAEANAVAGPDLSGISRELASKTVQMVQGQQQASSSASESVEARSAQSCQGVRIGAVGLMLSYEDSSELTEVPELYYLPNSPVWVKGLANLHGNLIPVLDVAEYLGIEAQTDHSAVHMPARAKNMLMVLGHGAEAAGVLVDGISQRLTPLKRHKTDTDTAPELLLAHLRGAYFIDNQLWFDLDCSSLLTTLEQEMMHQA